MKKLCLTFGATIMLSLGVMAQTNPTREQEKMSEPGLNMEVNRSKGQETNKSSDKSESPRSTTKRSKSDRDGHKTRVQKAKTNKPLRRGQNDEDKMDTTKKSEEKNRK
jgi:hypothetical protein